MGDLFFELLDELLPVLRAGDLPSCESRIAQELESLPESPFHVALDLKITNNPTDIAAHLGGFIEHESSRFDIAAAYTEMNGFDINPDRWYFDVFAFTTYGGRDDYDWLSDWDSERYPEMTITGLEPLQEAYKDAYHDERFGDASDIAAILVVIKFQDLIRRSAPFIKQLQFPLLATAHDYNDFIYEARRVD